MIVNVKFLEESNIDWYVDYVINNLPYNKKNVIIRSNTDISRNFCSKFAQKRSLQIDDITCSIKHYADFRVSNLFNNEEDYCFYFIDSLEFCSTEFRDYVLHSKVQSLCAFNIVNLSEIKKISELFNFIKDNYIEELI